MENLPTIMEAFEVRILQDMGHPELRRDLSLQRPI
jgi:hypothetical protein